MSDYPPFIDESGKTMYILCSKHMTYASFQNAYCYVCEQERRAANYATQKAQDDARYRLLDQSQGVKHEVPSPNSE